MTFRVALDSFRGPLDLLLYLVRKHEIDATEIPVAAIAEQFLALLEAQENPDVDAVGDFLEIATTLMETKSRVVLPRMEEEIEAIDDPQEQLVSRLLQYKRFRDAASMLEEQSRRWQRHYPRVANDVPPRKVDIAGQPIQEVELWDLVSAYGRIMRNNSVTRPSSIIYDETPIQVYMQRIHAVLLEKGRCSFSEMFQQGMHKSALIGIFLAILELVRHHSVRTQQDDSSAEIWILPGDDFDQQLELDDVDDYAGASASESPDATNNGEEQPAPDSN